MLMSFLGDTIPKYRDLGDTIPKYRDLLINSVLTGILMGWLEQVVLTGAYTDSVLMGWLEQV